MDRLTALVDDGAFRVVFTGPKGDVERTDEITVAFSRPIHHVGTLEESVAAAEIVRAQDGLKVQGTWRWFGERTAVFWPKPGSIAPATEYKVTVDANLRSFDGEALQKPESFVFASQRPKVVSAEHRWDEDKDVHTIKLETVCDPA